MSTHFYQFLPTSINPFQKLFPLFYTKTNLINFNPLRPINIQKYQFLPSSTNFHQFQPTYSIYQPLFTNEKSIPYVGIYSWTIIFFLFFGEGGGGFTWNVKGDMIFAPSLWTMGGILTQL